MAMLNEEVDGCSYKYDVFRSFRGEDTYCTFTGNLYHALRNKRIKTFFLPHQIQNDHNVDEELQLATSILKAIQESMISIVVLSENYASSTRCLDELMNILKSKEMQNQLVWPIFYNVEPSDVRRQRGRFGEAMYKLERDYPEKVPQWRKALFHVSNLAGWPFGTEYEFIQKIVESAVQWLPRYDVFLSFCGEDTRYSFTGFLYHALRREGFKIFMDDDGLEGGNQISQTLLKAIEKSRVSIVVLSENYGYSTWCLDELVKIIECMKIKNQLVWPIFYKIKQSDESNQTKSYGKAMKAHEVRFGKECQNVQKWRSALSEVALLKADHIKDNEYEYEFIKKIVERAIEAENHM